MCGDWLPVITRASNFGGLISSLVVFALVLYISVFYIDTVGPSKCDHFLIKFSLVLETQV